jgi:hypothetical protein
VQKENSYVPAPWGDALMAQAEAIQRKTIPVPRRRRLSGCRSTTTVSGLWLIITILLA